MVFVPEGQYDSSQARSALARTAVPQRGWRTQPRVYTLGTAPERFALKGRQVERTNNAKGAPIVASLDCAFEFWCSNRCELYLVSLAPLQHLQPGGPGVFHRGNIGF